MKKEIIEKKNLIEGIVYIGYCRNAEEAIWNKEKDCFLYKEYVAGSNTKYSWREIKHIADESNSKLDAFIPREIKLIKLK